MTGNACLNYVLNWDSKSSGELKKCKNVKLRYNHKQDSNYTSTVLSFKLPKMGPKYSLYFPPYTVSA